MARQRLCKAFTLLELLVVVSIIALLMAILLPALGNTRESARRAVCAAHIRGAAQAMSIYTVDNKGWLAGPNTSGGMYRSSGGPDNEIDATDESEKPWTAVVNMDWASPTLGRMLSLPNNDLERVRDLVNTQLRCPTNSIRNSYVFPDETTTDIGGVSVESISYASYGASLAYHYVPAGRTDLGPLDNRKTTIYKLPDDYRPKIDNIGNPARSAYLMEGTRYITNDGDDMFRVSFNTLRWQVQGGNFMVHGAASPNSADPHNVPRTNGPTLWKKGELFAWNREAAWRHREGMNMAFFDEHVEYRKVGESFDNELYWPSGTEIIDANLTLDPDDVTGQFVQ